MAFSGVRISWLITARNCERARLAASAASRATCKARCVRSHSVTSLNVLTEAPSASTWVRTSSTVPFGRVRLATAGQSAWRTGGGPPRAYSPRAICQRMMSRIRVPGPNVPGRPSSSLTRWFATSTRSSASIMTTPWLMVASAMFSAACASARRRRSRMPMTATSSSGTDIATATMIRPGRSSWYFACSRRPTTIQVSTTTPASHRPATRRKPASADHRRFTRRLPPRPPPAAARPARPG